MSVMQQFDLRGKTALVTGCKRGIGKAMAIGLAEAGADIIGVSASLAASGSAVEQAVTALGRRFAGYACDFSDRAAIYAFVQQVKADHPVIDILVNNAGTIRRTPAAHHADEDWDHVIDVNLTAQFVLSREFGKEMVDRGAGKVIFTASLLTFQGGITVPVASALCDDHCTHGGRYCHPEPPANLPPTVTGKSLVLEVLRRLCIDGYYHASDYKFFRYLENFERAGCLVASDMTVCSLEVMDKISFLDYANLETCVGDLNEIRADVPNPKLDEQIEAAQKHQIDSVTDIPSLYLGGVKYTGELSTEAIFREYCAVFERAGKMHPVSCDICKDCQNVRKCLWTLECDGVAFEETTFLAWHNQSAPAIVEPTSPSPAPAEGGQPIDIPVATLPPGGIAAPANSASTVDTTAVKTKNSSSSGGGANNQAVLVFFLIALCASALVAGLIVLRDRAHSKRMADVAASQAHAEGTYHDNAIGGNDYHDYDPDDSNSNLEHDDNGGYRDNSLELSPTRGGPPKGAFM